MTWAELSQVIVDIPNRTKTWHKFHSSISIVNYIILLNTVLPEIWCYTLILDPHNLSSRFLYENILSKKIFDLRNFLCFTLTLFFNPFHLISFNIFYTVAIINAHTYKNKLEDFCDFFLPCSSLFIIVHLCLHSL